MTKILDFASKGHGPECGGKSKPRLGSLCMVFFVVLWLSGCCTAPQPSSLDISMPGWTLRQGQAIWTRSRGDTEISGELLVATHSNGSYLVQLSKSPFTLVTAQRQPKGWYLDVQQGLKRYCGPGEPPGRIIWFQLASAISGNPLRSHWQFIGSPEGNWKLVHSRTGETLEGYLAP